MGPSFLSKPSVVTLPGILILLDWWKYGLPTKQPYQITRLIRRELNAKKLWIIPAVAVSALTIYFQYTGSHQNFVAPLSHRLILIPTNLTFYLWRTIWPFDLSFHYPHPSNPLIIYGAFAIVGIIAIVIMKWFQKIPALLFGALWFLCLWLPVSGIFQVGSSFTADRYTYLAHVGLFLGMIRAFQHLLPLALLLVPFLSVLSFKQATIWKNSHTLFAHGVAAQPRDTVALQNMGNIYQLKGDHHRAIKYYHQSLAINPRDHLALYNLGNSLRIIGKEEKARDTFLEAIRIYPSEPKLHLNLGMLLSQSSVTNIKAAEEHLQKACQLTDYQHPGAIAGLVKLYLTTKREPKAEELAKRLSPDIREKAQKILNPGSPK